MIYMHNPSIRKATAEENRRTPQIILALGSDVPAMQRFTLNWFGYHIVLFTILSGGIAGFGHSFGSPIDCDTRRGTGKSDGWQRSERRTSDSYLPQAHVWTGGALQLCDQDVILFVTSDSMCGNPHRNMPGSKMKVRLGPMHSFFFSGHQTKSEYKSNFVIESIR